MSGIIQRESNRFDATYENPWGGIASNADQADIQPSQAVRADGFYIKNGRMCAAGWGRSTAVEFSINPATSHYFQGELIKWVFAVTLHPNSETPALRLIALSENTGNAYISFGGGSFNVDQTLTGMTGQLSFDCYQIIAGVVYIFDFLRAKVYVYTPGVSFVVGSSYVGGKYCMVVTNYLITANTTQVDDSPQIKPNRYNWSAPFAYTTWDPADVALPRGAGQNTITSVSDSITNCFAMGNVGYVLRTQGVTQLSPTGVGIRPFDVTDLWDSQFGIGCSYPDTFDQYGLLAIWANDSNIFAFFSGSVPQAITGACQAAIYADINLYENSNGIYTHVSGCVSNTSENSNKPELTYTLVIIYNTVGDVIIGSAIWTYVLETKTWTRQTPNFDAQIKALTGDSSSYAIWNINAMGVFQIPLGNNTPPVTKRIRNNILISIVRGGVGASFLFSLYYNDTGIFSGCPLAMPANLLLRQEEIRLGTKPTVRGVMIKAVGRGTYTVRVAGVQFTDIVLDGTTTPRTYRSYGEVSAENPQVSLISSDADASITKIHMNFTYAEGSPF